jgi:hypothetical protein
MAGAVDAALGLKRGGRGTLMFEAKPGVRSSGFVPRPDRTVRTVELTPRLQKRTIGT